MSTICKTKPLLGTRCSTKRFLVSCANRLAPAYQSTRPSGAQPRDSNLVCQKHLEAFTTSLETTQSLPTAMLTKRKWSMAAKTKQQQSRCHNKRRSVSSNNNLSVQACVRRHYSGQVETLLWDRPRLAACTESKKCSTRRLGRSDLRSAALGSLFFFRGSSTFVTSALSLHK